MSKRRSGDRNGGRTAKRQRRQQHLYLVLDDWLWGYSIRKIDLSPDSYSDDPPPPPPHTAILREGAERRLPPAVFRLESHHDHPKYFAAAFGTKILTMIPTVAGRDTTHPLAPSCVAPVLDVRTRLLSFAPRPEANLVDPIFFPVDGRLFALCSSGSFQLLHHHRPPPPGEQPGDPCWRDLPKPPFEYRDVTAYAVHPDGRTILVSTKRRRTFTFDTAAEAHHLEWKRRHGRWALPFTGRAYFDGELDAWVGLSGDPGAAGHVCACDVAASSNSDDHSGDGWRRAAGKLSKEKLFSEDPAEKHVGATLVYMGGRSKFWLVQCVSIDDDDDCGDERNFYRLQNEEDEELDEIDKPCRYLFRLATFSLKFDKDGHLTTGNSRRVRYYNMCLKRLVTLPWRILWPSGCSNHDLLILISPCNTLGCGVLGKSNACSSFAFTKAFGG